MLKLFTHGWNRDYTAGSVLGPVLFILYATPLASLIKSHEVFTDDTQLNHSESPDNYLDLVQSLQDCVADGLWMEENKLKLKLIMAKPKLSV